MDNWFKRLARIFGNAGIYFVTPLVGTTLAQSPSIEASVYSCMIGLVMSASREMIDYGKKR